MTRHQGGDRVKAGFYLNVAKWNVKALSGAGGVLPGDAADRFLRVPAALLFVFAPLMGAAYAIFLPFIGIAMVAQYLTKKAGEAVADVAHAVTGTMAPAWRPGEAHFTGEPKSDTKPGAAPDATAPPTQDDPLKAVEDEIKTREQ
jgi:hypothetical protein